MKASTCYAVHLEKDLDARINPEKSRQINRSRLIASQKNLGGLHLMTALRLKVFA